ncbi:hypothetical protein Glove_151g38 [Diversispora epigaea]|uniref:Uncharacterized protein n=1 Tax=Diversispora epigaea TaxID=1348612 RepID=A0A397IT25_9GLOM|nr:hypothetical protein Glove_151g38 [Diversispora epigaea]
MSIYIINNNRRSPNYSSLPKPKNDKNFEKELEELAISTSALIASELNKNIFEMIINHYNDNDGDINEQMRSPNYSSLPKPKNDKNFEKELEELAISTSALIASELNVPDF